MFQKIYFSSGCVTQVCSCLLAIIVTALLGTSIAASVLINEQNCTPWQRIFIGQFENSLLVHLVLHQRWIRCRWRWGKRRPQFWSHDCTISCIIVTIVVYGLLSIVYCLVSIVFCLLSLVYCRCLLSLVYCLLSIVYCLLSIVPTYPPTYYPLMQSQRSYR